MTKAKSMINHLHLVMAVAALSFIQPAGARPWRPDQIPNGKVFSCTTCHNSDGSRNSFGLAVQARVSPGSQEPFWGPELAALDSDRDGFSNGQELGDPDGDGVPTPGAQVTRPGSASSKPSPLTVSGPATTQLALTLTWKNGTPPFLVQRRMPAPGAEWTDLLTTDARTVLVPRDADVRFFRVQSNPGKAVMPFTVWLSGATSESEPVSNVGAGFGTLTLDSQTLTLRVRFSGLSASASAAQIEGPAGTAEPFTIPLTNVPNDASGVIESRMDLSGLTADQIAALKQGHAYLAIQTPNRPGGEIRGRVAPLQLQSTLKGTAEQSNSATTATGSGHFWLVGNELTYDVNYANLSAPATSAYLHGPATADSTAGVLIPLQATAGMLGVAGAFSGSATLAPEQLGYLLDGLTYVSIQTSNDTDGELRGQVTP